MRNPFLIPMLFMFCACGSEVDPGVQDYLDHQSETPAEQLNIYESSEVDLNWIKNQRIAVETKYDVDNRETIYKLFYDKEGYLIKEESYYENEFSEVTHYTYDSLYRLIEEGRYYDQGETFRNGTKYNYGADGRLLEKRVDDPFMSSLDEDARYHYTVKYAYNDEGQQTGYTVHRDDGNSNERLEQEYDANGNVILQKGYNDEGQLAMRIITTYDYEENSKTDKTVHGPTDDYHTTWSKYIYDENGDFSEMILSRYTKNDVYSHTRYAYDDNHRLLYEEELDTDGSVMSLTNYLHDKNYLLTRQSSNSTVYPYVWEYEYEFHDR